MIIGLTGFARTGKDSFADGLVEQHGFFKIGFATALKELAREIDPWVAAPATGDNHRLSTWLGNYDEDWLKTYTDYREFLKALGNGVRAIEENFWVDAAMDTMERHRDRLCHADFVFTDVRFPNEVEAIRAEDGYLVRLVREGYGPESDFERYVSDIKVDAVVGAADVAGLHALVDPTLGVLAKRNLDGDWYSGSESR